MKEEFSYEIILPIESHAKILWQWRNDSMTIAMSFTQVEKKWEEFWQDFQYDYFSFTVLPSLFIHKNGSRIGYLRFRLPPQDISKDRKECEISINLSSEYRGHGLSKSILKDITKWVYDQSFDDIYAYVKENNVASLRAFESAGYVKEGKTEINIHGKDESVIRFHYQLKDSSFFKNEVYIIAEAGSNWRIGDEKKNLEIAKRMIEMAAESGANCIKFQVFKAETLYVKNAGTSHYLSEAGIDKEITSLIEDLAMPYEDIALLKNYCDEYNIDFMATFFSSQDFFAVDPFVKVHKIASYEISHPRLIELAAKSKKPLILSTGASNIQDIQWAVDHFYKQGGKELILLQCTAKYPADPKNLNLNVIQILQRNFHVNVGLSDHSKDHLLAPITAVALGAKVIEKHFTLDRHFPGPDHFFAILPSELKEMINSIRIVEKMLGSKIKKVLEEEKELFLFANRSVQAIADIKSGEIFQEGINIDILRPGNQRKGCHPKYIDEIQCKKSHRNIQIGDGIFLEDWKRNV